MILKALYDYYHRCGDLPRLGRELKQIGFLIVINSKGDFLRIEDCRTGNNSSKAFLVKKSVKRSSNAIPNYLYDNCEYTIGYSQKEGKHPFDNFYLFKEKVTSIFEQHPDNATIEAVHLFYQKTPETILSELKKDSLWGEVEKSLNKKYAFFSFRVEGDSKIVAEHDELIPVNVEQNKENTAFCLITGNPCQPVITTTATMIPKCKANATLVAFQVRSGYDSYGKTQGHNAPISKEAEFAYTTALNHMLRSDSHNKFSLGSRTFVFWSSTKSNIGKQIEESLCSILGVSEDKDNPNANINNVKKVFKGIYTGQITTDYNDRFYVLGMAPNSARIAVVYWSEQSLEEFAGNILKHFNDMEIIDSKNDKRPFAGLYSILSAVTIPTKGKESYATPNLGDSIARSIFQGTPYPDTLFASCIRRLRADKKITICRMAILKAYLTRKNYTNNNKITTMLDKENNNPGYLCGRLFAVLVKMQKDANNVSSIKERYMNAASTTPASVFSTILNLSIHHAEKLSDGLRIMYEKLKQEIMDKISADGFPSHLNLQDQGRFFIGYYHQKEDFFTRKNDKIEK